MSQSDAVALGEVGAGLPDLAVAAAQPSGRLLSVDALRGFDMFWIIGIDEVIWAAEKAWPNAFTHLLAVPFTHQRWEGFNSYDLVFPLFIFLVGVSVVFSLTKQLEKENRSAVYLRIVRRFVLLYLAAFVYNGSFWGREHIVWVGVLPRIAWCYLITSVLFCIVPFRGLIAVFTAILISYWALLTFVPPPDQSAPTFEIGKTWPNYIDIHYLPEGNAGRQGWSNEGYLSTVPAVATCLLGVFVGAMLKNQSITDRQKVAWLLVGGAVMVALGYLWGIQFPVIKRIWTSTYVLVAGGYSCLLLGLFYLLIDMYHYRNWATPFFWIGSNAITAYLICGAFPWGWALRPLEVRLEPAVGGHVYDVIHWSIVMVAVLVVVYGLYRKKLFLRL